MVYHSTDRCRALKEPISKDGDSKKIHLIYRKK